MVAHPRYEQRVFPDHDGAIRGNTRRPNFVWDAAHGMREITYPGWDLYQVNGISADGTTLFGLGTDPSGNYRQGWVASIDALTLVAEPGTCVLIGAGLAALAARPRSGSAARRQSRQ